MIDVTNHFLKWANFSRKENSFKPYIIFVIPKNFKSQVKNLIIDNPTSVDMSFDLDVKNQDIIRLPEYKKLLTGRKCEYFASQGVKILLKNS